MLTPFVTTLMIGFGGGIGAATRFLIYFFLDRGRLWPQWKILLCINLLGSLAIGFLSGFLLKMHADYSQLITDVLLTGFLGGFTTFSAFMIESTEGLQNKRARGAVLFITLSIVGGVALAWLGQRISA
ncbi:MAG: CrcB family protein [Phycisphaerales bacterium]|nr:CrcB family protein [Phycisphaerales bacterium]